MYADISRDKIGDRWKVHRLPRDPRTLDHVRNAARTGHSTRIEGLELGIVTLAEISEQRGEGERENGCSFGYSAADARDVQTREEAADSRGISSILTGS